MALGRHGNHFLGFGVERFEGFGFEVWGLGLTTFEVRGLLLRVWCSGFRVASLRFGSGRNLLREAEGSGAFGRGALGADQPDQPSCQTRNLHHKPEPES